MAELFAKFEVNREARWPVILKLLAGSLALHVLASLVLVYVPGVRAAFNIASLVAGAKYVDKDYKRTEIVDEVQLVELTREKFHYPEGYFAPEGQAGMAPPVTPLPPLTPSPPQFVAQAQPPPVSPEILLTPSPSPSPVASPVLLPTPIPSANASSSAVAAKGAARGTKAANPAASPSPVSSPAMTAEEAQAALEKTAAENNLKLPKENEINKKALKDFAAYANDLKKQGKLDLNQPFEIVIEAVLDENGKLKDAKFTKKAGDANLVDLFGRMVGALNDSGFLGYLKPLDKDNPGSTVVFTVKQGETEVLATVESEASSAASARSLASGFNAALVLGAGSRAGKDEEVLLRNTSAEPVGKKIVFNFTMPRQAVVDLIKKQLAAPDKPS
jgi:hypothetical protein